VVDEGSAFIPWAHTHNRPRCPQQLLRNLPGTRGLPVGNHIAQETILAATGVGCNMVYGISGSTVERTVLYIYIYIYINIYKYILYINIYKYIYIYLLFTIHIIHVHAMGYERGATSPSPSPHYGGGGRGKSHRGSNQGEERG
jgi:hypothetical protein